MHSSCMEPENLEDGQDAIREATGYHFKLMPDDLVPGPGLQVAVVDDGLSVTSERETFLRRLNGFFIQLTRAANKARFRITVARYWVERNKGTLRQSVN